MQLPGAIVLDSDDTLTVTHPTKWRMYRELGRRVGIPVPDHELRHHWGLPIPTLEAALFGTDVGVLREVRAHRAEIEADYPVISHFGVQFVLESLQEAGIPLGVLSSTALPYLIPALTQAGIATSNFRIGDAIAIQGGGATRVHKPHGGVFAPMLQLIEKAGITGPVTYVGDDIKDCRAARAAGLDFVGVTTGLTSYGEFVAEGATVFRTLIEALPHLLRQE